MNSLCRLAAAALVALETSLSRFGVTAKAVLRLAMGSVTLSALTVHAGVILPDLPVGTQYQLMFMTDETIITTSGVIADYNSFVATSAVKSSVLAGLSAEWRAVASTFDVSANSNAPSNGLVFNTAGQQVASPIRSLYSGTSLFAPVNYNQYGDQVAKNMATGSDKFGNKSFFLLTQDGGPLGYLTYVQLGNYDGWNNATWLENGTKGANNAISGRSIYALSSVITVVPEPSTWVMGLAGIACGGYSMFRRRKRA